MFLINLSQWLEAMILSQLIVGRKNIGVQSYKVDTVQYQASFSQ